MMTGKTFRSLQRRERLAFTGAVEMLRTDLENEPKTVERYCERIQQAEVMGEFALSETLRSIIVQEQEPEIDLSAALGIDVPFPKQL